MDVSRPDILGGRQAAESLMTDTCTVRDAPTSGPMDPVTGDTPEVPGAVVYSGKIKIQSFDPYEQSPDGGDHKFIVQRYILHFPVSATRMLEDYRVLITGSETDPHNVGRLFRVAAPQSKTYSTAQRVNSEELVGR